MTPLLLLLSAPPALAWPAASEWVPLTRNGAPIEDSPGDVQTSFAADYLDLVGSAVSPVGFWYADADTLYLRLRISESPWAAQAGNILLPGSWTFAFDTDGDLDTIDLAVSFSGSALGDNTVLFYRNNNGNSGAGADLSQVYVYSSDPLSDGAARTAEANTTFDGEVDWTIDLAIDRADLEFELELGELTAFRLAPMTADSRQSIVHDADLVAGLDMSDLPGAWSDVLVLDADGDGLTEAQEALLGTDPDDADTDDDGLDDGREDLISTDPLACDSDGDWLPDGLERGVDEPGVDTDLDAGCFLPDLDPSTKTNANVADTDGGGIDDGDEDWSSDGQVDYWEIDPEVGEDDVDTDLDTIPDAIEEKCDRDGNVADDGSGGGDSDRDTLPDAFEWSIPGLRDADGDGEPNFCDRDSDGDGIYDSEEGAEDHDGDGIPDAIDTDSDDNGISDREEGPDADNDSDGIPDYQDTDDEDGPTGDADGDGLTNAEEDACGSDPLDPDTDGDGVGDMEEGPCNEDDDCDGVPNVFDAVDDDLCDRPEQQDDDPPLQGDTFTGGNFTGGACNVNPAAPALWPALLSLIALARRRKGLLALLAAGVSAPAQAQDAGQAINAQRFRPVTDGQRFFTLDDTTVGPAFTAGGSLMMNYAHDPFIYRYTDGREDFPILSNVATADLVGWVNLPRVRVGVDLPLHLASTGYAVDGFRLVGDARVMGVGEIIERQGEGLGVAARAFWDVPTGNEAAWLGEAHTVVGAGAVGSYQWRGLLAVADLGLRSGTGQVFPDELTLGPRLDWGMGANYAITDAIDASLELDGELILGGGTIGSRPAEALAGVRLRPYQDLIVHAGVGGGISRGVGAPDVRAVLGVSWNPREDGGSALYTAAPVSTAPDRDGDGVSDENDLCPDQPEDLNGVDDQDGCPEGNLTPTRVLVLDAAGDQISPSRLEFVSGPDTGSYTLGDGELVRSLEPGAYKVSVSADGYTGETFQLEVPQARIHEHSVRLDKLVAPGSLRVMVRDTDGRPLTATLRLLGEDGQRIPGSDDGLTELSLPPGAYSILISAPDHRSLEKAVELEEGGSASVDVVLEGARVKIEGDRVVILDKVFFELDSDVIKKESFSLLDEVVETLMNHPELVLVEVQGHTDDQGRDAYNDGLSQRRAEAVRRYLVQSGIDPARLQAKGYGERAPLMPGTSEDARAANRRVEFHILSRENER
ncbi:MAG: OmpA family protein [Alphaproteobacteria bacterium]|nr:OmpA family protein [Alphaproteobacteria bacterium]